MKIKSTVILSVIAGLTLAGMPAFIQAETKSNENVQEVVPTTANFNVQKKRDEVNKSLKAKQSDKDKIQSLKEKAVNFMDKKETNRERIQTANQGTKTKEDVAKLKELKDQTESLREKNQLNKEKVQAINQIIKERRDNRMSSTTIAKREAVREKLSTDRNKNILKQVDNTLDRLSQAVDRLISIGEKAEARINKMEEAGISTAKSEELLSQFKSKAAEADKKIEAANKEIDTILAGQIDKDTGAKVKKELKQAEESVKLTHKALVDLIVSIKMADPDKKSDTASTTNPTPTQEAEDDED